MKNRPSRDQSPALYVVFPETNSSSIPLPSASFENTLEAPALIVLKAIRFPSGAQIGVSMTPSNVSRVNVDRGTS
jgi:hypothetical protein